MTPNIPSKNPAAMALGRLGGTANTKAQNKARAANGSKGGRPRGLGLTRPELRALVDLVAAHVEADLTVTPDAASAAAKLRRGLRPPKK